MVEGQELPCLPVNKQVKGRLFAAQTHDFRQKQGDLQDAVLDHAAHHEVILYCY